jgi:hypothetical protein
MFVGLTVLILFLIDLKNGVSDKAISCGVKSIGISVEIRIKLKKKNPTDPRKGNNVLKTEIRINAGVIIRRKITIEERGIRNNEPKLPKTRPFLLKKD